MNENVRRIGKFFLKSAGIVCSIIWIVLVFWMAGLRLKSVFTGEPYAAGKILEAFIYLILSIPGFLAIRRDLHQRRLERETQMEESTDEADD